MARSVCLARTQEEGECLQTRKKALTRTHLRGYPDWGLPGSCSVGSQCRCRCPWSVVLLKQPEVGQFIDMQCREQANSQTHEVGKWLSEAGEGMGSDYSWAHGFF